MFALLAGAALSFGAARHHGGCRHHDRRAAFEARVARVCVDAARQAQQGAVAAEPGQALSVIQSAPVLAAPPQVEERRRHRRHHRRHHRGHEEDGSRGHGPTENGPPGYSPSR